MSKDTALNAFFGELEQRIDGEIRRDAYAKVLYSTDASIYQIAPLGVLIPRNISDVHAAVELAASHRIPLLPRTSGSSLAGQAVNEAVVIDFTRHLNQVIDIEPEGRWVRVQPGMVLDVLNQRLAPYGLQFGPDPASSNRAAMGGIVANNSTGSHSILYGMTADHVQETSVILSDGSLAVFKAVDAETVAHKRRLTGLEGQLYDAIAALADTHAEVIRNGTPRHWRRCGGYNLDRFVDGVSYRQPQSPEFNLAKLICGSEGTLAVITELQLGLVPKPAQTALAIVQFDELYAALAATPVMLQAEPSAVELLDHWGLHLCREVPAYARLLRTFLRGDPHCIMITEFYGSSEKELRDKIAHLEQHLRRAHIPCEIVPCLERQQQENVWTVRKAGLGLLMSMKGDHKPIPFIEDAAVPVEHLADYVTRVEKFCNELGSQVSYYAHASAGCIHIRPLINTKVASEVEKLPQISRFALELVGGYGGAWSSEHGDGRSRSWLNEAFFGPELYGLYRQVKSAFDPHNLLNPGMVVDAAAMTEHLRYGADYAVAPVQEHLDFSSDQGFHRAVEMCNGAGVCRKITTGTMCPSFMVTGEEEHSTRGRANALRAALSGRLAPSELTSKRMYEVMDLCIECKACKAECPSSVDMAKIKFEFLSHYHEQHRPSLRTKLFARMPAMSRYLRGPLASLANRSVRWKPLRRLLSRSLGITPERSLPAFAPVPFSTWFAQNRSVPGESAVQPVVLFVDTFANFNEPAVAIAATELLEAAGFTVIPSNHGCCGRPLISKGFAEPARQAASKTVAALFPYASRGIPIVGLEPSCLLTLRDEFLYLLPGDEQARVVAEHSLMIEELLIRRHQAGALALSFRASEAEVLLHGHCHQKALVGTDALARLLALPGYRVEVVDSGCCGMAGSFGYEAEHYDLSMKMAERRLLPAVRRQAPGAHIAASGFSCRHQIRHGAGRAARHPVEILRDALLR